jgi:maltooligosyltrehalose trehalohydrolase
MQHLANLRPPLGATYTGSDRYNFHLWAPAARSVQLRLLDPQERLVPMQAVGDGFFQARVDNVAPGTRYHFRLESKKEGEIKDRPDPASRAQPEGVHGPSQLIDPHFEWSDDGWAGLPLQKYIIYELHVGTFTPEGTFDAIIPHLGWLKELGVTALELMPVAHFPGERNWGYDGVAPFAVQDSYGGHLGLKRLVNACHEAGIAVILDVVYNHLGAEGNYLWDYGPYFTDRYQTPWGSAVNFDGPGSDQVRRYFIENAVYFLRDFHVDALRLDAIHAMLDFSASHFLEELAAVVDREAVHLNRRVHLIAESDLNDARVVRSREDHGFGLDAQWSDDFHHALHVLLTGESQGYYRDFVDEAGVEPLRFLAKAISEGYVYSGQYSVVRGRRHGNSSREIPAHRFVICIQNHDQVGNRMNGERLAALASWPRLKLAAAVLLLSPYVPLLFMGEEYGESAPFLYFTSHSDQTLVELVREGRKREFADFMAQGEPADPYAAETFARSKLNFALAQEGKHCELRELYRTLIHLRKTLPALELLSKEHCSLHVFEEEQVLLMHRWYGADHALALFNFDTQEHALLLPVDAGEWCKLTDSNLGKGPLPQTLTSAGKVEVRLPAESFALYAMPIVEGS